jgi:GT2 family glycosyltransferase
LNDGWLTEMVGANMAFHRRVLERVPKFDEELGPGALGFCDDSLFSWQLEAAGFRLGRATAAVVEHHCEVSRLLRRHYLDAAKKHGRSQAYLLHHWKQEPVRAPRWRIVLAHLKLLRRRITSRRDTHLIEGCADWEISLNTELEKYRGYLRERQRPRNYAKRGLIKLPS